MKQYYILLATLLVSLLSFSQDPIVNIPDANFKNTLLNDTVADFDGDYTYDGNVDTNNDGEIQVSEAESVTRLKVNSKSISSLTGLEYFTNLKELQCASNSLTSLNLNGNVQLEKLLCNTNQLSSINLSANTELTSLQCASNSLTSLDVNVNTKLTLLNCTSNLLTGLSINANTLLTSLYCDSNQLSTLDTSANILLKSLVCKNNVITSLDVSANTVLTALICSSNQLTSLNVVNNVAITQLQCNSNQLVNLNLSTNIKLMELLCDSNQLASLNVSSNVKLSNFHCIGNQLTSLDVSNNIYLSELFCTSNQLTSINLGSIDIQRLSCGSNKLTSLNVDNNTKLNLLYCDFNQLTNLDVSNNIRLGFLRCGDNQLLQLNLKNGKDADYNYNPNVFNFQNNPTLKFICINDHDLALIQSRVSIYGYTNCVFNSYCSFVPGGTFYSINGQAKIDTNNNGCDVNDLEYKNLKYTITDGSISGSLITNADGGYSIPVQAGTHTITPVLENPTYFNVLPSSLVVNFPTETSPYNQDFCITPNGTHNDLEVSILPIIEARPGFDAAYKLVYKNKGTTTLSGSIDLLFNDAVMDFVSATPVVNIQSTGLLKWNYSNLKPFDTKSIDFVLNINTPTDVNNPVNGDDVLDFTATINPVSGDETPDDNVFELHQTVVNSYDPNDKTCLEGKTIAPSEVGKYVHYMIRFENTGSANAVNIVVKDVIDTTKYDVSTLIPLHGSHSYVARVRDTNIVEFIFENINLPFDNANNDGYVAFKIKTQPTLVVNDTFENNAEIYFDYNAPIITNVAQTIVAILGLADYQLDNSIGIYPNPAKDTIYIQGKNNLKEITVFDVNGRVLSSTSVIGTQLEKELNVTELTQGIYFVRVVSDKGQFVSKLIKE